MEKRRPPFARPLAAAVAVLLVGACATEVNLRGNAPDTEQLSLIQPGAQSRDQVIQLLGSPTVVSTFDQHTVYYISQRTRTVTYHEPEVLTRQVIEIRFDQSDRVAGIRKYDLRDGKQVDVVERTTPTPGRQFTLLQQLLGNLGRFEGENKRPDFNR